MDDNDLTKDACFEGCFVGAKAAVTKAKCKQQSVNISELVLNS